MLGHEFRIVVPDRSLAAYLDRALGPFAVDDADPPPWMVVDQGVDGRGGGPRFAAYRHDETLFVTDDPEDLAPLLLWWVNRVACFETRHRLMVHASVAVVDGRALVMPAPQQSGKTTLVAGLVRRGFGYLTDEAAAFDPATGRVEAYPKSLSIDPGSWDLLSDLRPDLPEPLERFAAKQWHVDVETIRPGAVTEWAVPGWIVVPRYRSGAATAIEPLGRPVALTTLADECFNLARFGQPGLERLADVVRRCSCWRLTTGDLDEAVEAVRSVTC